MKTKTAKTKKATKKTVAATKNTPEQQKPQNTQAHDGAVDETPEPPQMMHPLSSEERARKRDDGQ